MAKKIRNTALAGAQLNVPGVGLVQGSMQGVYVLPDDYADELLLTPGWSELTRTAVPPSRRLNPQVVARAQQAQDEVDKVARGEITRVRADEQGAKALAQVAEARRLGTLPPDEGPGLPLEQDELEGDDDLGDEDDEGDDEGDIDDEGNELEREAAGGDPTNTPSTDEDGELVDLDRLSRNQLFELAAKLGVETRPSMSKAAVIEEMRTAGAVK